jgi:hypothetical protein
VLSIMLHTFQQLGLPIALQAAIDDSKYLGRSFRIGVAATAVQQGIPDSLIKTLGRWESSAYTIYICTPRETLCNVAQILMHYPFHYFPLPIRVTNFQFGYFSFPSLSFLIANFRYGYFKFPVPIWLYLYTKLLFFYFLNWTFPTSKNRHKT